MKYFRKRTGYRKRRMFRRARRGYKKGSAVSARVRRYVKKAIHRQLENKERCSYAINTTITSSDSITGTYPLLLSTGVGTNEEQRVGNQIKIVKGTLDFCINLLPYNATTNPNPVPVWVRVMVVRDLVNMAQTVNLNTTVYNNIFRAGATTYSFGGNPLDIVSKPNKDYVRVLYNKIFKLGNSYSYTGGSPTNGASYFDNSPSAKRVIINWAKWARKQIKFSDGLNYPSNDNLYLIIQPVNADGSNCSGKSLCEWHYTNVMQFEDA